jgi:phage baseplate assembly protein W
MSGRHLKFPFTIGEDGRPETPADLSEHVKGEVMQLLLTDPGERPFLPRFGGGLKRLVFEANSEVTAGLARARLTKALSFYLGERLVVRELVTDAIDTTLSVDLVYELAATAETRRLRFEHEISGSGDV